MKDFFPSILPGRRSLRKKGTAQLAAVLIVCKLLYLQLFGQSTKMERSWGIAGKDI